MSKTQLSTLVLLGFTTTTLAAASPEHPSERIDYVMAYIPFLQSIVMQGGWSPPDWTPTNEAWKWDGHRWSRLDMAGSPAFAHHTMAFDFARNVLVICGRPTPTKSSEYQVWEFNGTAWNRKANVPVSADAQGDPKLTYDARRKRLVLYVAHNPGTAEVWESDGKNWQLIRSPQQPVRCDDGCLFQYDGALRRSVLVGEERTSQQRLAWDCHEWAMAGGTGTQTWLWDGVNWGRVPGKQPPHAVWGGMAFDIQRNELLLLTTRMETWAFRGGTWVELRPKESPRPVPNGFFAMAHDTSRRLTLFFGGESRRSEPEEKWQYPESTWTFDGIAWIAH